MKIWQRIKKGEIQDSGTIRAESQKLKDSRQKMKADLIELESSLKSLQQDLLAENPGALDAVRATEASIAELRNKGAATESVIKDLEKKLEEALGNEQARRQAEITQKIAAIDNEVLELRQKALSYFSKAAIIINKLFGNEGSDQNLSYDFFQRCNLSTELHKQIDAGISEQEALCLSTKREHLLRESTQLNKSIS